MRTTIQDIVNLHFKQKISERKQKKCVSFVFIILDFYKNFTASFAVLPPPQQLHNPLHLIRDTDLLRHLFKQSPKNLSIGCPPARS